MTPRQQANRIIRGMEKTTEGSWADPMLMLFDAAAHALKITPKYEDYYAAQETMRPLMDMLELRVAEALTEHVAANVADAKAEVRYQLGQVINTLKQQIERLR